MPRTPRKPEDVEFVKEKILDTALDILFEKGFNDLSMRKIAVKMKMTAANIYNYFSNKDEIYLAIQTRGFALLYERFYEIDKSLKNPLDKMRQMVRAYIDFGLNCADQYEIMFTRNTPKYSDYVGTKLEPAAFVEKQTALQVAEIATRVGTQIVKDNHLLQVEDTRYRTIQVWTALHGVVSLMNSRVLREVDEDTDTVIEKLVNDLIRPFLGNDKAGQDEITQAITMEEVQNENRNIS